MATFNSRTITVKANSRSQWSPTKQCLVYDKKATELRADSLEALLVSMNTLRGKYNFTDDDYEQMDVIRQELKFLLNSADKIIQNCSKK